MPLPRFGTFALLAAMVPALGCSAQAGSDNGVDTHDQNLTGPGFGVDYAWARPAPSTITADGYGFVVRYLSYDTTGKNLSLSEANELIAAGLDVAVVWESGGNDALDGFNEGVTEAQAAESQAVACGQPAGRPIYFAIDFDAQPSQMAAIGEYFQGVASVIGLNRTGAYGGYGAINALFDAGQITWGWQTYAWSGGSWDSRAQLRQIQNDIGPGGEMDEDQSMVADYGQWGPGGAAAGPPPATTCTADGVSGTCIDSSTCAGMAGHVSTPGLCPGAANIECCTVAASAPPPPAATSCTADGVVGTCIATSTCESMAGHVSTPGLCPGAANVECCTVPPASAPPPPPPAATSCTVDGVVGTCIDTSTCAAMAGYVSTAGFCPGAADVECCTVAPAASAPSCTVEGVEGTCIDTSVCTGMAGHVSTPGFCPGAADVECCTQPPTCSVNGVSGMCVETSVCAGLGRTSTPGYCPGAANEECCTP